MLGSDYDGSSHTRTGDLAVELAVRGIRLVIDELRTDVTKTLKDGSRGKLTIDYGDPRQPGEPLKWMWKFIDGARLAGELYGRALVIIAAEQYASRLVLPCSQHHPAKTVAIAQRSGPQSAGQARRPASTRHPQQLEKAVVRAHAEFEHAQTRGPEPVDPRGRRRGPGQRPEPRDGG